MRARTGWIGAVGRAVPRLLRNFAEHDVLSMAAAVSFYTALSFAPLVLLLTQVGGMFGDQTKNSLLELFTRQLGPTAADLTQDVVKAASGSREQAGWKWWFGAITLLITASGVFAQLQTSLNRIWEDQGPKLRTATKEAVKSSRWLALWRWVRKRLLSAGMVLSVLFILLVSLVVSTAVQAVFPRIGSESGFAAWAAVAVSSVVVITPLFAVMFKFLPDAEIRWRDVWTGAVLTSLLFGLGKRLLTLYVTEGHVGRDYGEAIGGLIILLVWVEYSAVIFLLGAEITRLFSGSRVEGDDAAKAARDGGS